MYIIPDCLIYYFIIYFIVYFSISFIPSSLSLVSIHVVFLFQLCVGLIKYS